MRRLPPIETRWTQGMAKEQFLSRGFTFQCPAWAACQLHLVLLTQVRQLHQRLHQRLPAVYTCRAS